MLAKPAVFAALETPGPQVIPENLIRLLFKIIFRTKYAVITPDDFFFAITGQHQELIIHKQNVSLHIKLSHHQRFFHRGNNAGKFCGLMLRIRNIEHDTIQPFGISVFVKCCASTFSNPFFLTISRQNTIFKAPRRLLLQRRLYLLAHAHNVIRMDQIRNAYLP